MRRYGQRDKNHKDIVTFLEKQGVQCIDLADSGGGVTDLVTYFRGATVFMEAKILGSQAVVKLTQLKFMSTWRGYCGFVRTPEQALAMAVEPEMHCLTDRQKDILAGLALKGKPVSMNTVEKLIR
jgi:hypothetical protein